MTMRLFALAAGLSLATATSAFALTVQSAPPRPDVGQRLTLARVADREALRPFAVVVQRMLDDEAGAAVQMVAGHRELLECRSHPGGRRR